MTGSGTALVPDPSSSAGEGHRREPGATDAGSPFPAFGKGVGGLGSGSGAAGSGEAHALYGENPAPTYPERARRDNQQGTVLLRVLVEADGSVARVEVAQSSGFDALDRAAAETVRTRWRFVPARRDGANAASWVLVPIRFALRDA